MSAHAHRTPSPSYSLGFTVEHVRPAVDFWRRVEGRPHLCDEVLPHSFLHSVHERAMMVHLQTPEIQHPICAQQESWDTKGLCKHKTKFHRFIRESGTAAADPWIPTALMRNLSRKDPDHLTTGIIPVPGLPAQMVVSRVSRLGVDCVGQYYR